MKESPSDAKGELEVSFDNSTSFKDKN